MRLWIMLSPLGDPLPGLIKTLNLKKTLKTRFIENAKKTFINIYYSYEHVSSMRLPMFAAYISINNMCIF